jgi:hypothetical protein
MPLFPEYLWDPPDLLSNGLLGIAWAMKLTHNLYLHIENNEWSHISAFPV